MIERLRKIIIYLNALFFSKKYSIPLPQKDIICQAKDVKFYADTPNTIIYYDVIDEKGFFRECKQHLNPREFTWQLIEEYCKYVYQGDNNTKCALLLKEKLSKNGNLKKFFHMGAGTSSFSKINKFRHTLDAKWIGINKPYPKWFEDQLLHLVQYAWGALDEYKYCQGYSSGQFHMYNFNRTMVSKAIVDLLGTPSIIPECQCVKLVLDGEERIGVAVGVAPGISPAETTITCITPEFQRQSLILNIADVLCYQKDHRPGNYFVTIEDDCVNGLCAFDNDCPTTLFNTSCIAFETYSGCSPIINKNGFINRPFLDKSSTELLLALSKKQLFISISEYTSKIEREFIWKRVAKLKKAIRESIDAGILSLLEKTEWTNETISEELSGKYGVTYAKLFVERYFKNK